MPEKRAFNKSGSLFLFPFLLILLITSCIPQKRILILQDKSQTNPREFTQKVPAHKIQPGDELYVRVIGLDAKTYALFNGLPYSENSIGINYVTQQAFSTIFINSYTVNDSGYIQFPLIQKLLVKDLYVDDAQRLLQDSIATYANFAVVILKYVNFNVTVLGEVKLPGVVKVDNDQITIFQAIGLVGDMTDYANKNTVTVIRKTATGTRMINVNLSNRSIFESECYYLMPDDIVYIAPMGAKAFGLRNFQLATILSIFTSVLLLYSLIK
jgi:polysaccharide biosynthesis/export protein